MNVLESNLLKSLQLLMDTNGLTGAVLIALRPDADGATAVCFHVADPAHAESFEATELLAKCVRGILHQADTSATPTLEEGYLPQPARNVQ